MIELVLKGALSYLLGSVMGSLTVARLTGGADIRTLGSGNAGATNALRTQGMKMGQMGQARSKKTKAKGMKSKSAKKRRTS